MNGPAYDPGAQETLAGSPRHVQDVGLTIDWQLGPVKAKRADGTENGVNGTTIERVLEACRNRLEGFQRGPFACLSNAEAMAAIEDALAWLEWRTSVRQGEGIEGQNLQHQEDGRAAPEGVVPRIGEDGIRRPSAELLGAGAGSRAYDPSVTPTVAADVLAAADAWWGKQRGKITPEERALYDALAPLRTAAPVPGEVVPEMPGGAPGVKPE